MEPQSKPSNCTRVVGEGDDRTAYLHESGSYVIKVGEKALNYQERTAWKQRISGTELEKYFARIDLSYSGPGIKMERADKRAGDPSDIDSSLLRRNGITPDFKRDNIGVVTRNGKRLTVFIDYPWA